MDRKLAFAVKKSSVKFFYKKPLSSDFIKSSVKDLALITSIENPVVLNSRDFILAIREELDELL